MLKLINVDIYAICKLQKIYATAKYNKVNTFYN